MKCRGACGRELVPSREWSKVTDRDRTRYARNQARGLCGMCHKAARLDGTLIDYERRNTPADQVVEEWTENLDRSVSIAENVRRLAPRMGMSEHALYQAVFRARRRGLLTEAMVAA